MESARQRARIKSGPRQSVRSKRDGWNWIGLPCPGANICGLHLAFELESRQREAHGGDCNICPTRGLCMGKSTTLNFHLIFDSCHFLPKIFSGMLSVPLSSLNEFWLEQGNAIGLSYESQDQDEALCTGGQGWAKGRGPQERWSFYHVQLRFWAGPRLA
jgi:hypothetical protein